MAVRRIARFLIMVAAAGLFALAHLTEATREHPSVEVGASPRGTLALLLLSRTGIWQALLLRSFGLGSAGAAVALGFSQLELSLPFWGLAGLLLAAWAALVAFRREAAHRWRSDGQTEEV